MWLTVGAVRAAPWQVLATNMPSALLILFLLRVAMRVALPSATLQVPEVPSNRPAPHPHPACTWDLGAL